MARRSGRGEGSVRRLTRPGDQPGKPTGLWEGRATLGYQDGKRVRRSFYGRTRAEASAAMVAAIARAQEGVVAPSGSLTVERFLTEWLAGWEGNLRSTTADRYRTLVERHIVPEIGRVKLRELQPEHVNRLMAAMLAKGMSTQSANHARNVLRTALSQAERESKISRNVAKLARAPKIVRAAVEPMTVDEARAILAAVRDTDLEGPVATALWLGLRIGEVVGLRWRDVDTRGWTTVTVAGAMVKVNRQWRYGAPKTEKSVRTLSLPAPLAAILQRLRESDPVVMLPGETKDGPDGIPRDLLFTTDLGAPLDATALLQRFQTRLRQAGLPRRRFHDLRHGAGTLWLSAGVDLKTVSTLLGHSNISTTANVYVKVLQNLRTDAATKMTELLG